MRWYKILSTIIFLLIDFAIGVDKTGKITEIVFNLFGGVIFIVVMFAEPVIAYIMYLWEEECDKKERNKK